METLGLLGVPLDTSSSSAADIAGYISTVNQALVEANDQLASLSTEALAFSGGNVLELNASQIKAANMSRIPKHWRAWGPFPASEQGIYQKAYEAALQSRVVGQTIKTLQERQANLNTSLEQAKVREVQSVRQSISSDLSAITAPAQQQLAAHRQALENQFSDSATRTNAEREAANQAVRQAVEQAYQQIDALITSAGSRVNAGNSLRSTNR